MYPSASVPLSFPYTSPPPLLLLVYAFAVSLNMDTIEVYKPLTRPDRSSTSLRMQGKVAELRLELNSGGKKDKNHSAKKIALKKIVANMTMSNNDMIGLFPDVIGCMNLPSLEIKKMYANLYICL